MFRLFRPKPPAMQVHLPDGTTVRCLTWEQVDQARAEHPDWLMVTDPTGEVVSLCGPA